MVLALQSNWDAASVDLVARGWTVAGLSVGHTTQIEGMLPAGEKFYLHAKGDTVSMAIGGDEPSAGAPWTGHVVRPEAGEHWASDADADVGLPILLSLTRAYTQGEPSSGWW